jgi:hypothetical protein
LAKLWSTQDDVTLGNPFGPFVRGFEDVVHTMQQAASFYRNGEAVGFDLVAKHLTEGLALPVEVERLKAKMGARGRDAGRAPHDERLSKRGRCMEAHASPRGPDHVRSLGRLGDSKVATEKGTRLGATPPERSR